MSVAYVQVPFPLKPVPVSLLVATLKSAVNSAICPADNVPSLHSISSLYSASTVTKSFVSKSLNVMSPLVVRVAVKSASISVSEAC